ncbi:hypothetical protein [Nostoc sp. CHAB 5715]|uniref:hypothetical protein n=1 Tax=Nostoc sp. CHAB 5715 TaxID=2780400 RepID=UPI001E5D1D52|nr:hypothetical protein [Nostoc sp. CHAB 5715]MCC5625792.1 hypothetical protein [Nostoc sp. CHAB 5715]
MAGLNLLWRNTQMQLSILPKDSFVAQQQKAGLNQDIMLNMKNRDCGKNGKIQL